VNRILPTAELASLVYGENGIGPDDPAEELHEASRLYAHVAPQRLGALLALSGSSELQQTVSRASRLHRQRPGVDLPHRPHPTVRFRDVLRRRRSQLPTTRRSLRPVELGGVLAASYGVTLWHAESRRRPVPSAGGLYPLEVYVAALAVDDLESAVYHYDPFRHRLERLGDVHEQQLADSLVDPTLVSRSSALVTVTAMFWRTRFKYGVRGYRFALLEAGHLIQNVALAAAAMRLSALPLGGFYDRRVDALVGADGLDEATVHAVLLGGRE
jgi:SagB-type dehydrogenase family enzyme